MGMSGMMRKASLYLVLITKGDSYGEYSFYKPREAHAMKQTIRRQKQQRMAYYEVEYAGCKPVGFFVMIGMTANAAAVTLISGNSPSQASDATRDRLETVKILHRHWRSHLDNHILRLRRCRLLMVGSF